MSRPVTAVLSPLISNSLWNSPNRRRSSTSEAEDGKWEHHPFTSHVADASRWKILNKNHNKPLMLIPKGNYLPTLSFGACASWHGRTGIFIIPETTKRKRSSSFQLNQDFLHELTFWKVVSFLELRCDFSGLSKVGNCPQSLTSTPSIFSLSNLQAKQSRKCSVRATSFYSHIIWKSRIFLVM